jgi:hypothetical protein
MIILHSEPEASGIRNIMKFVGVATAMTVLADCAVVVPLPSLATFSQDSRYGDFACATGSKCPNVTRDRRFTYRRSQTGDSKIDEDPPDFILNSVE